MVSPTVSPWLPDTLGWVLMLPWRTSQDEAAAASELSETPHCTWDQFSWGRTWQVSPDSMGSVQTASRHQRGLPTKSRSCPSQQIVYPCGVKPQGGESGSLFSGPEVFIFGTGPVPNSGPRTSLHGQIYQDFTNLETSLLNLHQFITVTTRSLAVKLSHIRCPCSLCVRQWRVPWLFCWSTPRPGQGAGLGDSGF